jgi:undecaprenyl-diphosphatase
MLDYLLALDRAILIAVNGCYSSFADAVMLFFSAKTVWIPLYVLIAAGLFCYKCYGNHSYIRTIRQDTPVPMWLIGIICVAALGICFGLCDQISSLIKESLMRLRPSNEPTLVGIIRTPEGLGGLYGFPSSHAANTFGFALLSSLIFRRWWYSVPITLWAAIVSYSRIYLAKHYPLDVICGAILGLIIAIGIYYLWKWILSLIRKSYSSRCSAS